MPAPHCFLLWRVVRAAIAAATLMLASVLPSHAQDFVPNGRITYDRPNNNGVALDWCLTWAKDCGQPLADRFCQNQGHASSIGYLTYAPGRTWVMGGNQICEGPHCGGMLRIDCARAAAATPAADPSVANTEWSWFDNGNYVGVITFHANGTHAASWTAATDGRWGFDGSDLIISGSGYVTRLRFDSGSGAYVGTRDPSSSIQDGAQTVLRRR